MRLFSMLAIASVAAGLGTAALAADADALVAHRQQVMNAVGAHMGSLSCAVKMECTMEAKLVEKHAKGLAFMAGMSLPAFKDKADGATLKHTTKPDVWKDWATFERGMKAMESETAKLAKVGAGGDLKAIGPQLAEVGKTCKGCHDDFRTK